MNVCPRCQTDNEQQPLYQCVRCFTVYCSQCEGTEHGKKCPKCGMSPRMILAPDKK